MKYFLAEILCIILLNQLKSDECCSVLPFSPPYRGFFLAVIYIPSATTLAAACCNRVQILWLLSFILCLETHESSKIFQNTQQIRTPAFHHVGCPDSRGACPKPLLLCINLCYGNGLQWTWKWWPKRLTLSLMNMLICF